MFCEDMKKAIILNNIDDVRHCLKNNLHQDAILYSTHSSVDIFLKEYNGIECHCLSRLWSIEETKRIIKMGYKRVAEILNGLDESNSKHIQKIFGINMRLFVPLYAYPGLHQYTAYIFFVKAVEKILTAGEVDQVLFYNYRINELMHTNTDMHCVKRWFFEDKPVSIVSRSTKFDKSREKLQKLKRHLGKIRRLDWLIEKCQTAIGKNIAKNTHEKSKRSLLFLGPLYELKFLPKKLLNIYNVVEYQSMKDLLNSDRAQEYQLPEGTENEINFRLEGLEKDSFDKAFLQDIQDNLRANISVYYRCMVELKSKHRKMDFQLVLWGNPPICGVFSLFVEYLRNCGVKVLGAQHGGAYGDSVAPKHYISDYDRSDYYFSYGFKEEDLLRGLPEMPVNTQILPVGKRRLSVPAAAAEVVDIVYPVTNSKSLFGGAMMRVPPHVLTERQVAILEYLDSLKGMKVVVKPFANASYGNCSILPILRRLKNVKIVDNMNFLDFLEKFKPRCTVVEFASTPQFEVLHLDTEILLMSEWIDPYEAQAFEKLSKRLHFTEDLNEMIDYIKSFVSGVLPQKRDSEFFDYYIGSQDTERKMLQYIELIVAGLDPVPTFATRKDSVSS